MTEQTHLSIARIIKASQVNLANLAKKYKRKVKQATPFRSKKNLHINGPKSVFR